MEKHVSIREFAMMVGFSNTSVSKAIRRGVINKGAVKKEKLLIGIIPHIAADEWGKPLLSDIAESVAEDEAPFDNELADYSAGIPIYTPRHEAERMISVYKATKAKLEYLETKAGLVHKDSVYTALKVMSEVIKKKILCLPETFIDNVLSAKERNEAIIIMDNALSNALTELSQLKEI